MYGTLGNQTTSKIVNRKSLVLCPFINHNQNGNDSLIENLMNIVVPVNNMVHGHSCTNLPEGASLQERSHLPQVIKGTKIQKQIKIKFSIMEKSEPQVELDRPN